MKDVIAKRASTTFLKAVILVIALAVIALCVFALPHMWTNMPGGLPGFDPIIYLALVGVTASTVPFFLALYQAMRLLGRIDKNDAFSRTSLDALRAIKFAAVAMSALYALALPLAYVFAELDDAPGLILISTAVAAAPLTVATFAAVLQKLVQNAIDLKTEHDLTV